nr:MAG TPA: hypothetical protein [Caudoviricetes sp.]
MAILTGMKIIYNDIIPFKEYNPDIRDNVRRRNYIM